MRKFLNKHGCDLLLILLFVSLVPIIDLSNWELLGLATVLALLSVGNKKYASVVFCLVILFNCLAYYNNSKIMHKYMLYYDKSITTCEVTKKDVSQCLQGGQGKFIKYEYLGRFWSK